VRLAVFAAQHVPAVQALLDDPAVAAFTPIPEPVPPEHAAGWLALTTDPAEPRGWVVLDGDEVVGFGCVPAADRERGEVELGYLVGAPARGRGVATFLLSELTAWAFGWGAYRVELHINADNTASRRVAERCGYVLEGTLRQTWLKPGRRVDTTVWSRLASDPNLVEDSPGGA
jgi:RimJ/RimL family protein N-acetyltransferase